MVRASLILAVFLLTACGSSTGTNTRDLADNAHVNSRNALARISMLEGRIDDLESEIEGQKRLLDATINSLEESRNNHSALLDTFNSNADKSNDRNAAQERDINWLMNRNGVQR